MKTFFYASVFASYSRLLRVGLIIILFSISPLSKSQVIYTDIDPDTVLVSPGGSMPWHYYYMDINQDSIIDFKLAHFAPSASWLTAEIYCEYGNNQDEAVLTSGNAPAGLSYNMPIGQSSGIWVNTVSGSSNGALFVPASTIDKYLGLRILLSGQSHYGWAKIEVPADESYFTIKGFAFNTIPNQSINAGDTVGISTSIPSLKVQKDLKVSYTGTDINIFIGSNDYLGGIVSIYNIAGQEIKSINISKSSFSINDEGLSKGLYIVAIKNNSLMQTRKLIIN